MAKHYLGNAVIGSPSMQTSTANAEILTAPQVSGFVFINNKDCHISTDFGQSWLFLKATQGLILAPEQEIQSFRIQENGISFQWTGYRAERNVTV